MTYNNFKFTKYEYNDNSFLLKLYYEIDELEFIEEINFNPNGLKLRSLNNDEKKVLDLSFKYLHLVAGISYYKLLLPKNIEIDTMGLSEDQKEFFDKLYLNGLGEFAFKNNLDLREKISFPSSENVENTGVEIELNNDFIVPIGGGKDSIVTLELLKKLPNQKLYTFSVNTAKPIKDCCDIAGCDNILVTRKIAPLLLEINKNQEKYNAFNGHVPITSIIAFISVSASILYNCNSVIISNEKSANIGNRLHNGIFINHQWSKSFEAELMMHNFIQKYITLNFNYFSLIRPIYEIHVAKLFSEIKKYDDVFSSCNRNFKIEKDEEPKRWCGDCDKCRFVFLILAPFMNKDKLVKIFNTNMLNDEAQLKGYEELVGLSGCKPFECVGEIEESIVAFNILNNTEFRNDFIVKDINSKISKIYNKEKLDKLTEKYMGFDFNDSILDNKFKKLLTSLN